MIKSRWETSYRKVLKWTNEFCQKNGLLITFSSFIVVVALDTSFRINDATTETSELGRGGGSFDYISSEVRSRWTAKGNKGLGVISSQCLLWSTMVTKQALYSSNIWLLLTSFDFKVNDSAVCCFQRFSMLLPVPWPFLPSSYPLFLPSFFLNSHTCICSCMAAF